MNQNLLDRRILAIALRSRRFAYAVFERSDRLLDWGMVFYPLNNTKQRAAASKRIASLFTQFTPSEVAVGKARLVNTRKGSGVRPILRSIRHQASSRLIPVRLMRSAEVKKVFRLFRAKSKYAIASMLAEVFPELLPRLPAKRRIWESEHPRMAMFDAIALGFAYCQRYGTREPTADC
jgi:D-alanyl-D-alanine carboxypeptidase